MANRCEEACSDFEKHRSPEMIHEWKMVKRRWEIDPTQPDPYVLVEKGKTAIHASPSILTLNSHSLGYQRCKTDACRD